jgi:hypothetical protein
MDTGRELSVQLYSEYFKIEVIQSRQIVNLGLVCIYVSNRATENAFMARNQISTNHMSSIVAMQVYRSWECYRLNSIPS